MTDNPYTASVNSGDELAGPRPFPMDSLGEIGKRVFLEWEKLRLIYIGVLGCYTVFLFLIYSGAPMPPLTRFIDLIFAGIFANICYFAGPFLETYVRWLGYRGVALRYTVFAFGVLLTGVMATVTIASMF